MSFTKHRVAAPKGFFAVEAAGLAWLAAAEGVPVAAVLDQADDHLTLKRLVPAPPSEAAAARFGRLLARTHDAGADAFGQGPDGWPGAGFIGDAPLSLTPTPSWGRFYAEQRVLPYARVAATRGSLSASELAVIERLAERLATGVFDDPAPPARLHGDLWSGNLVSTAGGVVLIDPAAHGGHRLTDLAMLELFGAPFLTTTLATYAEASTWLPPGWPDLLGLHQLHPLLVHAVLFGGGYGHRAATLAGGYA